MQEAFMYTFCNKEKPGKNESQEHVKQSLRMVSPDCDTKRTGPCKLPASSINLKGKIK
jgi:hypothetical protein